MKNLALLLVLGLVLSSCSLLNNEKETDIETPVVNEEISSENTAVESTEITEEDKTENDDMNDLEEPKAEIKDDNQGGYSFSEKATELDSNNTEVATEVASELSNDVESEEALNEVFNEIEELFELAEQNGGQ